MIQLGHLRVPGTAQQAKRRRLTYDAVVKEPADRDGKEDDERGRFFSLPANLRALKKLAIEVPSGILIEGGILVLALVVVYVVVIGC